MPTFQVSNTISSLSNSSRDNAIAIHIDGIIVVYDIKTIPQFQYSATQNLRKENETVLHPHTRHKHQFPNDKSIHRLRYTLFLNSLYVYIY